MSPCFERSKRLRKSLEAVAFSFVYGHEEDVNKVLLMAEY